MKIDFGAALKKGNKPEKKQEPKAEAVTATAEVVTTTPFDKLDIERSKPLYAKVINKINEMATQAMEIKVTDVESNRKANEMLIQSKTLLKLIASIKEQDPQYINASIFKNSYDAYLRKVIAPVSGIINQQLNPKISGYAKAEAELERRIAKQKADKEAADRKKAMAVEATANKKREEKNRTEALERQKKLDLKADDAGVERVMVDIPDVQEVEDPIVIPPVIEKEDKIEIEGSGTSKIVPVWKHAVIDTNLVPREYCSPDDKKLKEAVKAGIRNIAGCDIKEDFTPKTHIRSSR